MMNWKFQASICYALTEIIYALLCLCWHDIPTSLHFQWFFFLLLNVRSRPDVEASCELSNQKLTLLPRHESAMITVKCSLNFTFFSLPPTRSIQCDRCYDMHKKSIAFWVVYYCIAGNFWGRKLLQIYEKYDFCVENFCRLLAFSPPKSTMLPNFVEKTFANSYKTAKFARVFSFDSFPPYGMSST